MTGASDYAEKSKYKGQGSKFKGQLTIGKEIRYTLGHQIFFDGR
jgi:hypothetical protein